ncbi:hypothetical protein [Rhodovulum adriaticum]|uniref:Uncharacterized protein n=1 Tax=Rhodovulum adriaticum TaxID=35804 RepID=A0A4R2NFQ1_RHOAD|nr:hypothetical protein [Rhodovulum adriaticum]MBK1637179.1 hypothetical protein [Rhodovulum adriaticum]TCP19955.1 hypothetical protein EV656_1245 [Rhodovulum adriaticum]
MGKVSATILGAIIGGFAAVAAIVFWFGWGLPGQGQAAYIDPTRADYIDLLLTVATIFLGAVGLTVTVGALVVGLVALKTLREIKEEAADGAKDAAAQKINETMATELEPNVKAKVDEALPTALQAALLNDELGHKIMSEMAQRGELDEVLERVAMRIQGGGPEAYTDNGNEYADDEGGQA